MDWILNPDIWLSLLTLTALEIVLGIDNLVFIAVLVGKLPKEQRQSAQRLGIIMALIPRLVLILAIAWIIGLTAAAVHAVRHRLLRQGHGAVRRRVVPALQGDP